MVGGTGATGGHEGRADVRRGKGAHLLPRQQAQHGLEQLLLCCIWGVHGSLPTVHPGIEVLPLSLQYMVHPP